MELRFERVVPQSASRLRLEDYLLNEFGTVSKMYLRELVRDEKCEVNGRLENIGYRVRPNDLIEIWLDETRGTAMVGESMKLDIVFEDDDLIVIDKPAGMLVHPSHREKRGTLLNGLVGHLNTVSQSEVTIRPGLIHRLDKDTSGLIVAAKNARAHRILSGHFLKKRIHKRYLAFVEGTVADDFGTIIAPVGRFAERKHWTVVQGGKYAETRFWVRERHNGLTLLELEPVTGRTNQLRIHCESIRHPIVGDIRRGGREAARLYLHAMKLAFPHPITNLLIEFESPPNFPPLT